MKKKILISILILSALTAIFIYSQNDIYKFFSSKFRNTSLFDRFKYGEASDQYSTIKLKLKTDDAGAIKELYIYDYEYSEPDKADYFVGTLQKLANESKDKFSGQEIDAISGATLTTNTFRKAINMALNISEEELYEDAEKVSLKEEENVLAVSRKEVNIDSNSLKTGFGAYIQNQLVDAEYSKDGELVTHEYLASVMLQQNERIVGVKFDHIASNMNFTSEGIIPTGNARAYTFLSDSQKQGYSGICSDSNYINMIEFENKCIECMYLSEIKKRFGGKSGYDSFVVALERACMDAKFIGASKGDTLGMSCKKELTKNNILNAKKDANGQVTFDTSYVALTIDRELNISSSIFDSATNKIIITSDGKILGSRDKEIHTVGEMSNTNIYSKIDKKSFETRKQEIMLSDLFDNNSLSYALSLISNKTDYKGKWQDESVDFSSIDFLGLIDMLTKAYINARAI